MIRDKPMPARVAMGEAEHTALRQALAHYNFAGVKDPSYQSEMERRYCSAFCRMMGGGYADAVCTGTAALYVAIRALNLPRGSSVLCSPITDPGTLSAIILDNLCPRLMDTAPGSYNVGPMQVLDRLTPDVSAICVVHATGKPAEIASIARIAARHNLPIIEDCSQAHFAMVDGKPVGTSGTIAAFSTMYRKAHITGGCGGVVYTRNENLYYRALAEADRGKPRWIEGFDDRNPEQFIGPALNLHQSELACAIGIASLARIKDTIARRLYFVYTLTEYMSAQDTIFRLPPYSDNDSPFILPITVRAKSQAHKIEIAEAVKAEGIPLNPHYRYLASRWPWLRAYLTDDFDAPNAAAVIDGTFCLYLNENYGDQEASDITEALIKVSNEYQ